MSDGARGAYLFTVTIHDVRAQASDDTGDIVQRYTQSVFNTAKYRAHAPTELNDLEVELRRKLETWDTTLPWQRLGIACLSVRIELVSRLSIHTELLLAHHILQLGQTVVATRAVTPCAVEKRLSVRISPLLNSEVHQHG